MTDLLEAHVPDYPKYPDLPQYPFLGIFFLNRLIVKFYLRLKIELIGSDKESTSPNPPEQGATDDQ